MDPDLAEFSPSFFNKGHFFVEFEISVYDSMQEYCKAEVSKTSTNRFALQMCAYIMCLKDVFRRFYMRAFLDAVDRREKDI